MRLTLRGRPWLLFASILLGASPAVAHSAEFKPAHLAAILVHDLNPLSRELLIDAAGDAGLDDLSLGDRVVRKRSSLGHGYRITLKGIRIRLPFDQGHAIDTAFAPEGLVRLKASIPTAVISARLVIDMFGPALHESVEADLTAHGAYAAGELGFKASEGKLEPLGPRFSDAHVASVDVSDAGPLGKALDGFFKVFGFCSADHCSLDQFATEVANEYLGQFIETDAFRLPIQRALVRALADQKPLEFKPVHGMKGKLGIVGFETRATSAKVTLGVELEPDGEAAACGSKVEPFVPAPEAPEWPAGRRGDVEAIVPKSLVEHATYLAARSGALCAKVTKRIPFGKLRVGIYPAGKTRVSLESDDEILLEFTMGFDVQAYRRIRGLRSRDLTASLLLRFRSEASEGGEGLALRLTEASVGRIRGKLTVLGIPLSKRLLRKRLQPEMRRQAFARLSRIQLLTDVIPIHPRVGLALEGTPSGQGDWVSASFEFTAPNGTVPPSR